MRKSIIAAALVSLLFSAALPTFLISSVNASDSNEISGVEVAPYDDGSWLRIKTDLITILFPADGRKPMFLWWYSNDTDNIYVVKYKGLIEYMTIDYPYYLHRYQADGLTLQERLKAEFGGMDMNRSGVQAQIMQRIEADMLAKMPLLHPAFLPFSACQWNLTGPVNVTRPDGVSYISFNFTLEKAPSRFDFAEGNVMVLARFYTTDATENVQNLYNYTVHRGELKMDLVVKNWDWNIDKLNQLFTDLHDEFGFTIPKTRAGLALWTDLASINLTDIPVAELDASSTSDLVEASSKTSDIIVGDRRVGVQENRAAMGDDETPIGDSARGYWRLRFAKGSQTLAGFFDFVDKALVINETSGETTAVNVAAAYISAGEHMRLFIGYPYFGNNTLEHDPSIGVESIVPWLPTVMLMALIAATALVAVVVLAVRLRKKTVNIVSVK
jgi:hypothetical protein